MGRTEALRRSLREREASFDGLVRRYSPLIVLIAAIWLAHLVNIALGGALTRSLGLIPRRIEGLDGVLAMPFLHGNWEHLTANTAPLLILGAVILTLAPKRFWPATAICVLLGGALIWTFARDNNHIGASALVFGWFGYLVALGFLERSPNAILGAALAVIAYGAQTIFGLIPGDDRVSWDGHLSGLVAGIIAAWRLRQPGRGR